MKAMLFFYTEAKNCHALKTLFSNVHQLSLCDIQITKFQFEMTASQFVRSHASGIRIEELPLAVGAAAPWLQVIDSRRSMIVIFTSWHTNTVKKEKRNRMHIMANLGFDNNIPNHVASHAS